MGQLFTEWHKLYLEEAFSTTPHNLNVPSREPFERYKRWWKQFGTVAAGFDVFFQADTLKRLDEFRVIYEKERERVKKVLGQEPEAQSTADFGRPKRGVLDDILDLMKAGVTYGGILLVGYIAYDVYKDVRSARKERRVKELMDRQLKLAERAAAR
jgi:hypothetical protein